MPQGKSNSEGKSSNTSSSSSSNSTDERSNSSYYKPFGGWPGWMHSHGLKPWDLDDVWRDTKIWIGRKVVGGRNILDQQKQ